MNDLGFLDDPMSGRLLPEVGPEHLSEQDPNQAPGIDADQPMETTQVPPEPVYNMPPLGQPVMTPTFTPHAFPSLFWVKPDRVPMIGAGTQGAGKIERVDMALRSGVPDEVSWAIAALLEESFARADLFVAVRSRGHQLLRGVVRFVDSQWAHTLGPGHESLLARQKVSEALLLLRNAALDARTAEMLAVPETGGRILVERGLVLPSGNGGAFGSSYGEMRMLCLEIAEHVCFHLNPHGPESPLFKGLVNCLDSGDRGVLVCALRSLSRLCVNDSRDCVLSISGERLRRLLQFLLVDDSELVAATLDLLYQYTARTTCVDQLSIGWHDELWVRDLLTYHLVRLLTWKMERESIDYIRLPRRSKRPAPAEPPQLPQQILRDLLVLPEPDRALAWIRAAYEPDPEGEVTQVSLWTAYQQLFEPHARAGTGKRLLRAIDYIRQASSAFPTAEAAVLTLPNGERKFIIRGFKPREKAVHPQAVTGNISTRRKAMAPVFGPTAALVLQNIARLQGGRQALRPLIPAIIDAASVNSAIMTYVDEILELLG